jgi:hypothetical protein
LRDDGPGASAAKGKEVQIDVLIGQGRNSIEIIDGHTDAGIAMAFERI